MDRSHEVRALNRPDLLVDGSVPVQKDGGHPIEIPLGGGWRPRKNSLCCGDYPFHIQRPHTSMVDGAVAVATRAAGRLIVKHLMADAKGTRTVRIRGAEEGD